MTKAEKTTKVVGDWFDPQVREAVNKAARARGVAEPFTMPADRSRR